MRTDMSLLHSLTWDYNLRYIQNIGKWFITFYNDVRMVYHHLMIIM